MNRNLFGLLVIMMIIAAAFIFGSCTPNEDEKFQIVNEYFNKSCLFKATVVFIDNEYLNKKDSVETYLLAEDRYEAERLLDRMNLTDKKIVNSYLLPCVIQKRQIYPYSYLRPR